jgi:AraC-like DNA-binding protein
MATRKGAGASAQRVKRYAGYTEWAQSQTRREVAKTGVSLILAFGDPLIARYDASEQQVLCGAFVFGTQPRAALTTFSGHQHGVQVDLTPQGARAFLDGAVADLTDRTIPLDAVLGRRGEELVEQLASLTSWSARFDLLDRAIGAKDDRRCELTSEVTWLWRQLVGSHGNCRVEQLMDETGRSRRHVTARFRQQIGLSPKACARLLRFERAVQLLRSRPNSTSLGRVALAAGYYDQPHFNRDFRSFAGCTPTELILESESAPEVSFVQDRQQTPAVRL